ncbi:MAG: hypothetical protein NTY19_09950 [Planctomycetota bacterium]|nr:hypothetical protein [Planctomycetota bacterium]
MSNLRLPLRRFLVVVVFAWLAITQSGCASLFSTIMYYVNGGDNIDAEYNGLQKKKVAIVCVSNSSSTGPSSAPGMLERSVGMLLTLKGKNIKVLPQDEVANWIDSNDWNQLDYREIGRGVHADMVLAIDLSRFSLHEGSTLYRGQADVTVTVYDMSDNGKVAFRRNLPDFSFPQNGARHSTEMSEAKFRTLFVEILAQHVARYFFPYPVQEDFAKDAVLQGF